MTGPDNREALAEVLHYAQGFDDWGVANETEREWSLDIADAVLASGTWTPAPKPKEYEYLHMAGSQILGGLKASRLIEVIRAKDVPENGDRIATYRRVKGEKEWTCIAHWDGTPAGTRYRYRAIFSYAGGAQGNYYGPWFSTWQDALSDSALPDDVRILGIERLPKREEQ